MRSRLFQTGLALVLLGIAAPDSAISQTAPQVRNAPDFAGIIAGYRTQRAKDPDSCCTYSAPVFGREVRFHLFGTFEPAYEAKNDRQMILEFVPQGECVQNWTRKRPPTRRSVSAMGARWWPVTPHHRIIFSGFVQAS